jgi:hypothetical protein
MNTSLNKFKLNVLHFTYEISGEVKSEQRQSPNGLDEIHLIDVKLDKVIQVNHHEQRIPFSPEQVENMSKDILSTPMKYPQIIWFIQEQYEGDRWDLRHECEQMDIEDRREYLDSQESC